jgi:hypothetical protein
MAERPLSHEPGSPVRCLIMFYRQTLSILVSFIGRTTHTYCLLLMLELISKLYRLAGLVSPLLGQSSVAILSMVVIWHSHQFFEGI